MNKKQTICMWIGIGVILFIAVLTVLSPYRPNYPLFSFWTFLVLMLAFGLITTLKSKTNKQKWSDEMNLRKGFKRLVIVLSLIPVLIGSIVFIIGLVDEDDGALLGGSLIVLIGFFVVWIVYGVVLYVIHGFKTTFCENCERTIGKLEEPFKFKEHVVCAECHTKLNKNEEQEMVEGQ